MAVLGMKRKENESSEEEQINEQPSPLSYTIPSPSSYNNEVYTLTSSTDDYKSKKLKISEKLLETEQRLLQISQQRLDIDQKRLELQRAQSNNIEEILKEIINQKALLSEFLNKN
jgi:hypothetical protein